MSDSQAAIGARDGRRMIIVIRALCATSSPHHSDKYVRQNELRCAIACHV